MFALWVKGSFAFSFSFNWAGLSGSSSAHPLTPSLYSTLSRRGRNCESVQSFLFSVYPAFDASNGKTHLPSNFNHEISFTCTSTSIQVTQFRVICIHHYLQFFTDHAGFKSKMIIYDGSDEGIARDSCWRFMSGSEWIYYVTTSRYSII